MKRPIVWMAVPVCLYCIFGAAMQINFIILLIISLIIFSVIILKTKTGYNKRFMIFLSVFSLICLVCISVRSAPNRLVESLSPAGINAEITGRVKKINVYDDRMYVQLSSVNVKSGKGDTHLQGVLLKAPFEDAGLGDTVTAGGTLLPLERARNEGNFDPKSYYESIGMEAVLNTRQNVEFKRIGNVFYLAADALRRHFSESFEISSPNHKGELSSVIIGDKSDLDADLKELYGKNGIAHILAISGLHVSFAGLGIYKLLRRAGLDIISSTLITAACVILYVLLTGSSISAIRACVMFLFAAAADILGRSYDALTALSIQAIVTLLITPLAICGASFIMSYTAVLSIILANEAFGNVLYKLKGSFTILRVVLSDVLGAIALFTFMLPVNLYFNHSIPVYSIILNMLVIPLSAILMPLGMAAGFLGRISPHMGVFFAGGAEKILEFYEAACRVVSGMPFNTITPGIPALLSCIVFYVCLGWGFMIWKLHFEEGLKVQLGDPSGRLCDVVSFFKERTGALIFMLLPVTVAVLLLLHTKKDGFYISMIDVRQVDCILFHIGSGKNLLFDGGSSDVKDVYKNRIKPFLQSRGIKKIDMILVSHTDADHVNGLTELLHESDKKGTNHGNIKVGTLLLPDVDDTLRDEYYTEMLDCAVEKGIEASFAGEGTSIKGKGYEMECLSPANDDYSTDKNELSAVYRLKTEGITLLFTGDMTEDSERRLLSKGADVSADILKTAHHGSNYSSCEEFLEAVSPKLGIISCGVNNRYGHPGNEAMERFEDKGIPTIVTKESGQIFIEKSGRDFKARSIL